MTTETSMTAETTMATETTMGIDTTSFPTTHVTSVTTSKPHRQGKNK
jgi:hypothetical protein